MKPSFSASLAKTFCLGVLATSSLGAGVMQPASAATVTCAAIEATSIAMGIPPAFAGSCGAINPGDRFEISYIGSLDPTKFYSLEVANINNLTTNSQIFQNVQFLVSGIIHGNPITDGVITIWPTNDINNSGVPYLQQGVTDYTTNATSNTFPPITGIPVSTQASFILTTPQTDIGLGTAGLIITKPLQLSSVGVSSFTGFKIQGEIIRGSGPFSAGIGIFDAFTGNEIPNKILGNAYTIAAPAPLPLLGIGAALGWSRRLRRRVHAAKD